MMFIANGAEILLKITVVLGTGACVAALLRRSTATLRHAVWTATFLGVLILPASVATLPRLRIPILPASSNTPAIVTAREAADPTLRALPASPDPKTSVTLSDQSVAVQAQTALNDAPHLRRSPFLLMWLLGSVCVLLWMLNGRLAMALVTRQAKHPDAGWMELLRGRRDGLRIRRGVRLYISSSVNTPLTYGVVRPVILLPTEATEWNTSRRDMVLAHELSHIERMDALTQLIAGLATAMYWFHPAVWLAAVQLRRECEVACDERVLSEGMAPARYAEQLLAIARAARTQASHAYISLPMGSSSRLEARVRMILEHTAGAHRLSRISQIVIVSGCVGAALATAALRPVPRSPRALQQTPPKVALVRVPFTKAVAASSAGTLVVNMGDHFPLDISGVDSQVVSIRGEIPARILAGTEMPTGFADNITLRRSGNVVTLTTPNAMVNGVASIVHVPANYNIRIVKAPATIRIADVNGRFTGAVEHWINLERTTGSVDIAAPNGFVMYSRLDGRIRAGAKPNVAALHVDGTLASEPGLKPQPDMPFDFAVVKKISRELPDEDGPTTRDTMRSSKNGQKFIDVPVTPGEIPKPRQQIVRDSGSIVLAGAPTGAWLLTDKGNITVGPSGGPNEYARNPGVLAFTGKGDVTIGPFTHSVQVGTGSGTVQITMDRGALSDVFVTDNDGAVTVTIPKGVSADFELETSCALNGNASITTPFALRKTQFADWNTATPRTVLRATGQVGGGVQSTNGERSRFAHIRIRTRNGSITIRQSD